MNLNTIDQLGLYLLGILILILITQFIEIYYWRIKRNRIIKNYQIILTTLVLTLFSIFIFKVDWEFTGELKDSRITGSIFFVMISMCNLISLILIGFANIIKRIFKNK